ncbi:ABC-F family ATP-binding cassette domain-containing protein [Microvirga lotononidis]|uniref:ATPase component of ABC transporters with duplicated ATPase domain n=1 Tax=Microvirga lotononidis TaxID=864069 RepID=I4YM32_9HYPH|nr:ABC-F family ATP-binding cassette domain-containing protein [Microvirga lotononidis]EIM25024.1 ATPase component of ABC transporters with duplicated ATPase domain [Microvirga lotononidis]WQO29482.1 ABC-F family ATP-binding cassette domain-containing protein [Microvirga lotononidis]
MPASITLSHLSWSAPDGRSLLSDLDLSFGPERTGLVGRNGVGKTTLLRLITGALPPHAGSVTVHGSLGILRQTVQIDPAGTIASLFGAVDALALLRRAETGEASAEELAGADWTLEARMASALADVGLDVPPETFLSNLSGGQNTRARLAALIFAKPDFLLLDEPTNNLDRDGRDAVLDLLERWRGGAIVVSHDRELLDTMDAVVELTSLGATRYGGNWSRYRERKALELAAARRDLADAEKRVAEIDRKAQEVVERKARKDGAAKRKRARGDMPRILMNGLKNRSEETSGSNARLAERRRVQAHEEAASARERIEILQPFSVVLAPTHLPAGRTVLAIDAASVGYEPERPILRDLSFTIVGPERVAVTGPNGSGKTTLLALITGQLQAWTGSVKVMTEFALFDQQVSLLDPSLTIRDNFRRINPDANENTCRAALARFMFRADAALQPVSTLSGGQLLRAGLACVLGGPKPPAFLILDEPTNHLDIDSIEAVEAGLRAYDGALLIVSHDGAFLESVRITRRWNLGDTT